MKDKIENLPNVKIGNAVLKTKTKIHEDGTQLYIVIVEDNKTGTIVNYVQSDNPYKIGKKYLTYKTIMEVV